MKARQLTKKQAIINDQHELMDRFIPSIIIITIQLPSVWYSVILLIMGRSVPKLKQNNSLAYTVYVASLLLIRINVRVYNVRRASSTFNHECHVIYLASQICILVRTVRRTYPRLVYMGRLSDWQSQFCLHEELRWLSNGRSVPEYKQISDCTTDYPPANTLVYEPHYPATGHQMVKEYV